MPGNLKKDGTRPASRTSFVLEIEIAAFRGRVELSGAGVAQSPARVASRTVRVHVAADRRALVVHGIHGVPVVPHAGAEYLDEGLPVLLTEKAVQDEVARRVERHQEVEDVAQAGHEMDLPFLEGAVQQVAGRGQLAEEEEDDHGDQHDGDLVLLAVVAGLAPGHRGPLHFGQMHRPDQEAVEDGQEDERDEYENHHRQPVVDGLVEIVAAHVRMRQGESGVVGHLVELLNHLPFERRRDGEREAEQKHGHYRLFGPGLGAEDLASHGVANGYVSFHSEGHRKPD